MMRTLLRLVFLAWWFIPVVWVVGLPLYWMLGEEEPVEGCKYITILFLRGGNEADEWLRRGARGK